MHVHINGRLVEESEAAVSVFDRGFLFGDGIFESLRAVTGRVFRLERHLDRLERSASLIGMPVPWSRSELGDAVHGLLRANGLRDARIRLTMTRGPGRPGDYIEAPGPPTLVISAVAYPGPPASLLERGVRLTVSPCPSIAAAALNPAIKSISRLSGVLARREAHDRGAFEAVLLDATGNLTEGTASNIFLLVGGVLMTPPVPGGALPGVTREAVIELARDAAVPVAVQELPVRSLETAEEVFLTNTSWEVLPVTGIDERPVGRGRRGDVVRALQRGYRDLVARECAGG